jgi:hypothetical protein
VIDRQETSCQRQKLGAGTLTRRVRVSCCRDNVASGAKKTEKEPGLGKWAGNRRGHAYILAPLCSAQRCSVFNPALLVQIN